MNRNILNDIINLNECNYNFTKIQKEIYQKYKFYIDKSKVLTYYLDCLYNKTIEENKSLEQLIRIKPTRSNSGELEISTILPPNEFSCKYDCAMCPNEPNQPRSYLSSEGTPKLGVIEEFDAKFQIWRRLIQLEYLMGHSIDKMIHILLGGTFHSFPVQIIDDYISDLYYACNVYPLISLRKNGKYSFLIKEWLKSEPFKNKISLKNSIGNELLLLLPSKSEFNIEKSINTNLNYSRITGLVIETRPDQINKYEVLRLRKYGVTRVQLGIQHYDEAVLKIMNRRHTFLTSEKAIKILKDNGFKIDIHLLLDCPGTTLEKDLKLCKIAFQEQNILADYVKLYICVDVPFTKIRLYKNNSNNYTIQDQKIIEQLMIDGNYKSLIEIYKKNINDILIWNSIAETNYSDFLIFLQNVVQIIPTFIRLNRFHRDFPLAKDAPLRLGYESETLKTNLQQICMNQLEEIGCKSKDIRSREIRNTIIELDKCFIYFKSYESNGGKDFFISIESPINNNYLDSKILGMIRCRITDYDLTKTKLFPSWFLNVFKKSSLRVRELHIYGNLQSDAKQGQTQHKGLGKLLLQIAEQLTIYYELQQIVIISGIGVQNYYKKLGYELDNESEYMIKNINDINYNNYFQNCFKKIFLNKGIFPILFFKNYENNINEQLWIFPFPHSYHKNYIWFYLFIFCIFLYFLIIFNI
jgi:histone acetyltransferase (RNA polymerase elongator complex component)